METKAPSPSLFRGCYSDRNPSRLVGGITGVVFGFLVLLYVVTSAPIGPWSVGEVVGAGLVGGVGALLLLCGFALLFSWHSGKMIELEIAASGLRYGEDLHPWEEIQSLRGHAGSGGVQLFYQARGVPGLDRPIPLDRNPTLAEFEDLMTALRGALSERHPHVIFG